VYIAYVSVCVYIHKAGAHEPKKKKTLHTPPTEKNEIKNKNKKKQEGKNGEKTRPREQKKNRENTISVQGRKEKKYI